MKRIGIVLIALLVLQTLSAEVIVMKSGKRYSGEIVFQNEEVVIIRDVTGTRFQCPRADIRSIGAQEMEQTQMMTKIANSDLQVPTKRVSLSIEAVGGALAIPREQWGGYLDANFIIGSRRIKHKNILLGGAVGYFGGFFKETTYSFIPLQVVARVPIIDAKHAPQVNFSVGYGIATSKNYKGGLHAAVDVCYRYQMNEKSAVLLGVNVLFQQASLAGVEMKEGQLFTSSDLVGKGFIGIGAKVGIVF